MKLFLMYLCVVLLPQAETPSRTGTANEQTAVVPAAEAVPATVAAAADANTAAPPESATGASAEHGWLYDVFHTGAMKYMLDGGLFMWPILLLGILALGVIIERFRALMMLNTRAEELRLQVRELLEGDRVEEALERCDREQGPVPAILAAGLRKYLVARRLG
jgi:biopolymer transport protein ExbB